MEEDNDETFLEKHGGKTVTGILLLISVAGWYWWSNRAPDKPKPKPVSMVSIMPILPPPPPPPPPPPKEPEPVQEPEMKEETFEPEVAPDEAPPEPEAAAPDPIGTGISGDGPPDGFGLSNRGGGGSLGGIGGIGGRGGSKYGNYAAKVQSAVTDAMKRNATTRSAVMSIEVKIWADQLGRVTRAQLGRSTGDATLDRALREEVLGNLRLSEPPPAEMPMPINLRLTARKP